MDASSRAELEDTEFERQSGNAAIDRAFVEAAYLLANPDIAAAVATGSFRSGRHHYLEIGHLEGRLLAPPQRPPLNRFLFLDDGAASAGRYPPTAHVEVLIAARHGLFLAGWAADHDNPLTHLVIRGAGWSFCVGRELLGRVRRADAEAALDRPTAYAYGFWTFIHSDRDIPAGPCRITAEFADGTASDHAVASQGSGDQDLRNIVLGYLAQSQHLGNAHVSAIASIEQGIARQIVGHNRAISTAIVASAHVQRFHVRTKPPKASIVVCLYGKPEFLFIQASLYHACPGIEDYEFIYVSNSPEINERLVAEAQIASRIYGIDLTCVLLVGNAGFGAANNVAARQARSDRILIVNPDVFPKDQEWAIKHAALVADGPAAETTIFGASLYYDDASLMHGGMYFDIDRPLLMGADAITPKRLIRVEHFGKGAPADDRVFTRARPVPAVTGAFISIERDWFERLGGFTEDYVFGHYEDADLCLKSHAAGIRPWLQDIRLWHLEGKGSTRLAVHEGGSLVNRWLFSRNWADRIEADYRLGLANVHDALRDHEVLTRMNAGTSPPRARHA